MKIIFTLLTGLFLINMGFSQNVIKGKIVDDDTGEELIGAGVVVKGTTTGTVTDWDGTFSFKTEQGYPVLVEISYVGYASQEYSVLNDKNFTIRLGTDAELLEAIEIKGSRMSDKQKESPLTIESMDLVAIKETAAVSFYDGLGSLKEVDLTAASLGFKVINMRGFNSTSPVRSLQLIDGVDNQSPGLNFSLGNFLGAPELDINRVELVIGASSAFFGPNAFNGVINMSSKDPFIHKGLSASIKGGERNLLEAGLRYANAVKNKNGDYSFAYKFNIYGLRADDWEAENYSAVEGTNSLQTNPGGYDAVNIYGDEYQRRNDLSSADPWAFGNIGTWHRSGYKEIDLVDYDTKNVKGNVALHFRLDPSQKEQSTEVIFNTSYGNGTTVYQGDNRFSLRNINFFQNRLELRKRDKFFLRVYSTHEDAGDSYDPYFTALALQDSAKINQDWSREYETYWRENIKPQLDENGFPQLEIEFIPPFTFINKFDYDAADQWMIDNRDKINAWHQETAAYANSEGARPELNQAFFEPGTERFNTLFNEVVGKKRSEGGTLFFDKSALYHAQGEYHFTPSFADKWRVGFSSRLYKPNTEGTIFIDTAGRKISNFEYGFYTGGEKNLFDNKVRLQASLRMDKNQNFDLLFSPAASILYIPVENNFLRASFSSAIRNPTLADQYLNLNVGPAILSGNIDGVKDVVTVESFQDYLTDLDPSKLDSFDIAPIQPEQVQTFEVGYRTTLLKSVFVDLGYYFNTYKDFLGYNIGIDAQYDPTSGFPTTIQPYRYAANSQNRVTTQGFSIGMNYYFAQYFGLSGNYSWNKLITKLDDPVIPAYNTPENKFNLGFSGRNIKMKFLGNDPLLFGFNITYKWIEGFLFEGSPQFTGLIPTYDLMDAQINFQIPKLNTTLKFGASNILDNKHYETYGGPQIGRFAYASLLYDFKTQ